MELTEKNKQSLQPETWAECRQAMEEAEPGASAGIQHRIAEGYLRAGCGTGTEGKEIFVSGIAYKVLDKGKVTTFYDAGGNTLFSLENKRLAEMRGHLAGDKGQANGSDASVGKAIAVEQEAKKKLEKERKAAKDKGFAEPVIRHLIKRCGEDAGLAQDVMQGHKTWEECLRHIRAQAKERSEGAYAYVPDEVVYEWAEDYYRSDGRAEGEEKARKATGRKKGERKAAVAKPQEAMAGQGEEGNSPAPAAPEGGARPEGKENAKRNGKDVEGQIDLFSMMGM